MTPAASTKISRLIHHAYFLVALIVLVNLLVGVFTFRDYGESWDERRRYRYGAQSLNAYFGPNQIEEALSDDEKGPSYVMIAKLGSDLLRIIWGGLYEMEAFHFMHFLTFQVGLIFLYAISLRFFSKWVAAGCVAFFSTQPILWGHAFINPKDIPFMVFFLGSMALGLHMVDAFTDWFPKTDSTFYQTRENDLKIGWRWLRNDWRALKKPTRLFSALVAAGSLLGLLTWIAIGRRLIAEVVTQAYSASPNTLVGGLFARYAESSGSVPVGDYIAAAQRFFAPSILILTVAVAAINVLLIWRSYPTLAGWLWRSQARPLLRINPYLDIFKTSATRNSLLIAALMLGLTTSTRVLGPLAGLLVGAYLLLKSGRKAIPALAMYFILSALVTYLTWPEMWGAPLATFWGSLTKAANFPWTQKVRFMGRDYFPDQLPRSYLPLLIAIQFTEPTIPLFVVGLVLGAVRILRGSLEWRGFLVIASWFFIPFGLVILFHPPLYDNFRHFLFIIPPIFILAGFTLQALFRKLNNRVASLALMAALLLPASFWNIRLHPYQYVYYNEFVGGVRSVDGRYEMDYWVTSYREAAETLDQIAEEGARVYVEGAAQIIRDYARPDMEVFRKASRDSLDAEDYDYAVLPTRNDKDIKFFEDYPAVIQVGREGAVFTVVKELK